MQEKSTQAPEKPQKPRRSLPVRIARIVGKTLLFLLLFIILVFLLILTPPVQRFLTTRVENYLEKKIGTRVDIGRIGFGLSGDVHLDNVYIEDRTKDTLVYGGTIKANVNFAKLLSSELEVKGIELQNITAKIKRVLPDTAFNYQFIVDAFVSGQTTDTSTGPPMKMAISDVTLDNVALTFKDVVTGNDAFVRIGYATTTLDKIDPATQTFDINAIILRNTTVRVKQTKPLLTPQPLSKDIAEAQAPAPLNLSVGVVDLSKVSIQYDNDVSALYSNVNIGKLKVDGKLLDITNNRIHLDELNLSNTTAAVRLGARQGAQVVKEEVAQEVVAEATAGYDFRVDRIRLDNNNIRFDDDSKPAIAYGMDYSHLKFDGLNLHADNLVFKPDSTSLTLVKGSLREKSGFVLNELQGEVLYGSNQSYLKNLLIKTPGTELKRSLVLQYASLDELAKNFERTVFDVDVVDSRVQVKDILLFAPQLRSQPALRNPNDVWTINLVGNGTMDRLNVEDLRFNGFGNTVVSASGTLTGLSNPANAGGNFTIHRLRTSQADMALLSGGALSGLPISLPQTVDAAGYIRGNAGRLTTAMQINTTDGNVVLDGSFANLMNPAATTYNARIRTNGLRLGKILQQQATIGNLSGRFTATGRGLTPETINTKFTADISSVGYNRYNYRNIAINGSLNKTVFAVDADVNDPNAVVTLTASGDYAAMGPFQINGMIDSVKAHNLGFSTEPLYVRGKIDGTITDANPDNLTADVMITKGLVVAGANRLALDTLQLLAGQDAERFIVLTSDIVRAELRGQYNITELGDIILANISPYWNTGTATTAAKKAVSPYDIRFRADLVYSPALTAFVPDLKRADNVHAEGRLSPDSGLRATVSAPAVVYGTNQINNLRADVFTDATGLQVRSNIAHLISGSFDVYNTRLNATAMNNNVDFSMGIDDKGGRNKYFLGGAVAMPVNGDMTISLKSDSLLLNYDRWSISPNNRIVIGKTAITANDFVLAKDGQQLSVQSLAASGASQPLEVKFTNFRIGTITGFIRPDSTLVDGVINGGAVFTNLPAQPLFTSDLTVTDMSFRQDTVGNLNAKVSSTGTRYNADVTLTGRGNDLAITGYAEPQGADIDLNLDLLIRRLEMNTFEGAMKDFVTAASGAVNGKVLLRGSTAAPKIDGGINFDNVAISTLAIGGPLRVDDESLVVVSNKGLEFNRFSIRDSANTPININGLVGTTNFINYDLDLTIRGRNFMAVNLPKKQNAIYYGRLFISPNLRIKGTEAAPVVDGSLAVNEGTDFSVVVPQRDPGVVSREGVVQFIDFDDPQADSLFRNYDSLNKSALIGYDIATNLTISKDAKFNVVIDEANGDFVALQGEANLSAGIDPSGKVNMTGSYEIEQGSYQMSYNFLQRKFDIRKGSRIEWLGEPTSAQLNVTAVYVANTAPLDLVSNQIQGNTQAIRNTYLQKLPFQVLLSMGGELMKPQLTFDIQLPTDKNYGVNSEIIDNVDLRLTQLRQEPSELNKQVFALLLLNRFVGENPFESSGDGFNAGAFARQSVSKLLTEQLNNLTQDLIEGVDLTFDVASTDDYTTGDRRNRTDLNVGLSKQLLNNRLTVSVGSNFALEDPAASAGGAARGNNIAGNVAVNYQLSRDGRYALRAYRQNEYFGVVDGYIVETGLRFVITLDYDKFADIFRRKKRVDARDRNRQPKDPLPQ